ncbi:3-oxo-5-alpha-steroid 4-dehydrogenase-domain-containing protein [Xylariales sp. AK1849]|nr:3-oxo-5-alpha-steroid 4-dehydrogenase-domain-containing protein [Xylariales sp. AK1849]
MAIIQDWLPASRENYEFIVYWWTWYPALCSLQWAVSWYGMGKTSVQSPLNIPGRIAWFTMECPGFLTLLYIMNTLPAQHGIIDLPWQNKVLAGLFVIHYTYRAVLFPFIQPSMSPIHFLVWAAAVMFQLCNASCLASWLAAYGPTTQEEWKTEGFTVLRFALGLVVFYVGLTGNYFCDEELREIRRKEQRRQEKLRREGRAEKGVEKHYSVPQNGLFKYMLYPHYFMEWIEWTGFWIAAGWSCAPARCFLVNEFFAMWPRAMSGKKWYKEKFGEEKIKGKYAVIPGVW